MRGVAAASFITLALAVVMWSRLIDRMIFYPSPGVDLTPEALGVEAESDFLETEDGVIIHT